MKLKVATNHGTQTVTVPKTFEHTAKKFPTLNEGGGT